MADPDLKHARHLRPPIFTTAVVVIVLTGGVLAWQLLLRPRVVPGPLVAGGSVQLRYTGPVDFRRADNELQSQAFLNRLRAAIPDDRHLISQWSLQNTHFSIDRGPGGHLQLNYAAPGYSIRTFDWQNFTFKHVGTQQAPSQEMARRLEYRQQQLAEKLAGQAAAMLKREGAAASGPATAKTP